MFIYIDIRNKNEFYCLLEKIKHYYILNNPIPVAHRPYTQITEDNASVLCRYKS